MPLIERDDMVESVEITNHNLAATQVTDLITTIRGDTLCPWIRLFANMPGTRACGVDLPAQTLNGEAHARISLRQRGPTDITSTDEK